MNSQSIRKFLDTGVFLVAATLIAPLQVGAQLVKVRMGSSTSPPSLEQMTPYVAIEKGIFKKHGLDVQMFEFRGDAINQKALLSGEVDVTIDSGGTAAMVSASKGAKIRVWIVTMPVTAYHFVARKEAGTTLKALVGKSVAVSGVGAISYHIPRIVLERSGVDPDALKYIAVGSPPDRFRALVSGKVDATVVTNTEAAKLAQYPEIIDIVNVPKVVPEIPYEFGTVRIDYIQKNPETLYRLAKAIIEANRLIAADKAGTIEVARKVLKDETPEILSKAYDMADPRIWGVNGDMPEAAYNFTADFLKKVGYMTEAIPYNEIFDRRFVDRALKELGRK